MRVRTTSKRAQSGQAIILFTLMVSSVLIPIVGLAIDGGRGYLVRLKLSSAVDGGALAAARLLGSGSNAAQQASYADATAKKFVTANFPAKFFGADISGTPNVCVDPGSDSSDPCHVGNGGTVATYKVRTVAVYATAQMPTFFMRILGLPTVTVSASGVASRRDVRVVLAIDRSASMAGYFGTAPGLINDVANQFVSGFSGAGELGGRDEVGLVVFGGSAIVAYPPRDIRKDYTDYTQFTPPDNNFKASGNIPHYITDITSGSNTGTAEALYLAYMTLRADAATNPDLANKLNVIVLFTDGLPNGITAYANDPNQTTNYMMTAASGCTYLGQATPSVSPLVGPLTSVPANKNIIGWFSQTNGFAVDTNGARGFRRNMMAYPQMNTFTGHGDDIDAWMKNPGDDAANILPTGNASYPSSTISQMVGGSCTNPMTPATMGKFPDHDLFGNYTDLSKVGAMPTGPTGKLYELGDLWANQCGRAPYSATATSNSCQIGLASWQAAAHQAWKIWNQIIWSKSSQTNIPDPGVYQSSPVIFTIGYDHSGGVGERPDMTLLQMIANDPSSPVSFSGRVKGQAFHASDNNAVKSAFQQITSQILRLSQ
jgi:Flp pilus assembly protein TadG